MDRFHFRHLPVVDGNKLVGLVTQRDLLHASSSFLSDKAAERDEVILEQPVGKIMQRDVLSVQPHEPLLDAALVMWEGKLGCLPVTEEDGTLVGILTETDFIRLAVNMLREGPPPPPSMIPQG
jgi:CBS domain-containing protein